jgi:hypothetical protein
MIAAHAGRCAGRRHGLRPRPALAADLGRAARRLICSAGFASMTAGDISDAIDSGLLDPMLAR